MILVDYSQIVLASAFAFQKELKKSDAKQTEDIIRHITLSSIKSYRKQFGAKFGDITICADGRNYWRKDIFPYYKGQRKAEREASGLDWSSIFDTMSSIRRDLEQYFPYKVVCVDQAEADDVIAVLGMDSTENNLVRHGLEYEPEPVLVISSDKDFKQLQLLGDHIRQWSPKQKKFITGSHKEINQWRIEHIVKGDAGDGVPNILSSDDFLMRDDVGRQAPISKKRLEEFYDRGRDACRGESELRNWDRNQGLVDLMYIPNEIKQQILDQYHEYEVKANKQVVMNYLIKHRCKVLLQEVDQF